MFEIRFHGRGGQGAVTAANILAKAASIEGKDIQAFPMFGVERRGAPVTAFLRIDENPIDIKYQIYEPDAVVILDPSLIDTVDCIGGLKEGGKVLVNSQKDPSVFGFGDHPTYCVDATGIAVENRLGTKTSPIVNTAILGAYSKVWGNIGLDAVLSAIESMAPVKTEENKSAAKAAFEALEV